MATPGDFRNRNMHTRTKKRPPKGDIESVNKVISEVMVSHNNPNNPSENPFGFLWLEEKTARSQRKGKNGK